MESIFNQSIYKRFTSKALDQTDCKTANTIALSKKALWTRERTTYYYIKVYFFRKHQHPFNWKWCGEVVNIEDISVENGNKDFVVNGIALKK